MFTGARAATDSRAKRELRLSCPECSIDDTKVSVVWVYSRELLILIFIFYFFELVIYKHYGRSRFLVYIGIALTSFCRTALGRITKL